MRILFFLLSVWSIGLAAAGSFAVRYVDVGPKTASAFQGTTCCLASDSAGNQYVVGTIVSRFDLAFGDPSVLIQTFQSRSSIVISRSSTN